MSFLLFTFKEHVQEAMLYVKGADNLEPNARLEELNITREIAAKCGHKTKVIAAPVLLTDTIEVKVQFYCFILDFRLSK